MFERKDASHFSDEIALQGDVSTQNIKIMARTGKGMLIVRPEQAPYIIGTREGKKRDGIAPPPELVRWRIECIEKGLSLWTPIPFNYN